MSIESSLEYAQLSALLAEWDALKSKGREQERAVGDLAKRIVRHRSKLFDANATLLAEAPADDDPATLRQTESNQWAIKACTNALTEMTGVLGRASIPS